MAKMFPPTPFIEHGQDGVVPGEEKLFKLLRDLPGTEDWLVFHSVHENVPQHDCNYEADFIVLIPEKGILALEVKSHEKLYVNPNDINPAWRERNENGPRLRHVTPLDQACRAVNKFISQRARHNVFVDNYTPDNPKSRNPQPWRAYGAVLMCDYPANAVPMANDYFRKYVPNPRAHYICGSELDAPDLREKLESFFDAPKCPERDPAFNKKVMDAIEADVHASIRFLRDPKIYIENLERATQRFAHILEMAEDSSTHLLVQGCAGSGKTCMLVYEVERLVEQARKANPPRPLRILVLCYNPHLEEYLKNKLPKSEGQQVIDVRTVESLAYSELGSTAEYIPYDQLPGRLNELILSGRSIPDQECYDHIFVDEVQDISSTHRRFLERYERRSYIDDEGRLRRGRHYYFADTNQSLYDRASSKGMTAELPYCAMSLILNYNLRNSWQITHFSSCALPEGMPERLCPRALEGSHGPAVRVLRGGNVEERRTQLEDLLRELLNDKPLEDGAEVDAREVQGLMSRDIVVLSPHAETHPENSYAGADVGEVLCRSIKKFKGLESLCVILTDAYPPSRDKNNLVKGGSMSMTHNDLYVAATRAKFALYIIPTAEGKPEYDKMRRKVDVRENYPSVLAALHAVCVALDAVEQGSVAQADAASFVNELAENSRYLQRFFVVGNEGEQSVPDAAREIVRGLPEAETALETMVDKLAAARRRESTPAGLLVLFKWFGGAKP